jgi:hypothetical protein
MELSHARRLVKQGRAEWDLAKIRMLSTQDRIERAHVVPSVAVLRAAGVPAVSAHKPVPRRILWPAKLTVIERVRKANGSLDEDPTEFRTFARYPDERTIAAMRKLAG